MDKMVLEILSEEMLLSQDQSGGCGYANDWEAGIAGAKVHRQEVLS